MISKPYIYKIEKLRKEEEKLLKKLKIEKLKKEPEVIVFLDSSYFNENIISCFLFYSYKNREVLKKKFILSKIDFPYIPTYLSLREGPNYIKGLKNEEYDLMIIDGQGIAHPRKMGIATYLGIKLNKPSIGVAKNILYGTYKQINKEKGLFSEIIGKNGELIGYALITKEKTNPIFISPGNLISFEDTLNIINSLIGRHRIPEPLREVHIYSREVKRSLNENIYNR
ncbi:MAG TPA: endonuclease V [Caldisericia bacterium]|nr:endonuclease V [Caldisericia bacterium]HRU74004.1 endonuclease V [Caldisericia bacterium]